MSNPWFDSSVGVTTDYSSGIKDVLIRSQSDNGRARNRAAYPESPAVIDAQIVCTPAQAVAFEDWYYSSSGADNGSVLVEFPSRLPTGQSTREGFIRGGFTGPDTLGGGQSWTYRFSIELIDRPSFTGDWFDHWPEGVRYAAIFDQAVNLEWPEE